MQTLVGLVVFLSLMGSRLFRISWLLDVLGFCLEGRGKGSKGFKGYSKIIQKGFQTCSGSFSYGVGPLLDKLLYTMHTQKLKDNDTVFNNTFFCCCYFHHARQAL